MQLVGQIFGFIKFILSPIAFNLVFKSDSIFSSSFVSYPGNIIDKSQVIQCFTIYYHSFTFPCLTPLCRLRILSSVVIAMLHLRIYINIVYCALLITDLYSTFLFNPFGNSKWVHGSNLCLEIILT